jgi:thioredoxin 1
MPSLLSAVTDADWEAAVLVHDGPLVVAFHDPDSSPCRAFGPTLEALGAELAGRARVLLLDVLTDPVTPRRYEVTTLPTLLVVRRGGVVGRIVGAAPKERVLPRLLALLS